MAIFRRGESRTEFANLYTRSFQEPFSPYMKFFWEEEVPLRLPQSIANISYLLVLRELGQTHLQVSNKLQGS